MLELLTKQEEKIRQGKFQEVVHILMKIPLRSLTREQRLKFANLARRAGLVRPALKALRLYVREMENATEEEKCEYAASLIKVGAIDESLLLLREIRNYPQKDFISALSLMRNWDYVAALNHLNDYLSLVEPESYQASVAELNRAMILIFLGRGGAARQLLDELKSRINKKERRLLWLHLGEAEMLWFILQKDLKAAEQTLRNLQIEADHVPKTTQLLFDKWTVVIKGYKWPKKITDKSFAPLRTRAAQLMDWETLRECDFYQGLLSKDQGLLLRVYFGTPFAGYRKNLLAEADWLKIPESFIWTISSSNRKPRMLFDVSTGRVDPKSIGLKTGLGLHRLLAELAKDQYRPAQAGSLFAALCPNQYFHPVTSYNRVHQQLRILRQWLKANKLPAEILERGGAYLLSLKPGLGIKLFGNLAIETKEVMLYSRLARHGFQKKFKFNELQIILGLSKSRIHRWVKWACQEGRLKSMGRGKNVVYQLVEKGAASEL